MIDTHYLVVRQHVVINRNKYGGTPLSDIHVARCMKCFTPSPNTSLHDDRELRNVGADISDLFRTGKMLHAL